MTDQATKKRNTTGPLDEFTIAARVCRILESWPPEEVDVEKEVREAIAARHAKRQAELTALYMRATSEEKRIAANNLVAARKLPLCGFELYAPASNDTPAPGGEEGEEEPELPPGARPIEPERAERIGRLTGGGRK